MTRTALLFATIVIPCLATAGEDGGENVSADDAPAEDTTAEDTPAAEPAGPTTYALDSAGTVLIVRTYKGGLGGALAHDHAIRSMKTTGSVAWQPGGEGCNFDIQVDVGSFRLDHAADRKIMGLSGEVGEDQVADIMKNMYAADQLNVATHKKMSFKATKCTDSSVAGMLTMVGKSVPKKVPLTISVEGDTLHARGTLNFKHTDFGIEPYSLVGFVKNQDELVMKIDLKANK
jgi:polyisoprenoid-binding protein YceI